MIGYNNSSPKAVNNVGQFGATEGSIGAYKSAAEYAADAKYWALLSQNRYSSVDEILAEVERLYAQGLLLESDIQQLKNDFEAQNQTLLGLIQSTGTAIDNTNAATELSKEATQQVLAQLDIISNMTVQTTLLPPGSMATGSYDNSTGVFSFGIPEGQPGRDGTNGTISDIGDVAIGVPVSDDYGFYVDKNDGGLYRANMSDIANIVPSIRSISINGGEEQTGAVSFNSVSSFNNRTGDVVAQTGDYEVGQITGAAKSGANSDITSLSGLTTALSISQGGTGASTPEASRTNLGLGSVSVEDIVPLIKGGTGATTPSAARTNLGLGLVSTESIVPISKGGTGSTSAENARLALVAAKSGTNSDITSMTNSVTFTQPVSVADAVDATNAVNLGQISSDQGASLIGTLEGVPVQNIISNINTDIIQLKLKWAIENGYSDAGFTFTTGGTLTVDDRDKTVYDPISMTWYGYTGTLPVVVPAGFNPVGAANWKPMAEVNYKLNFPAEVAGAVYRTEHDKLDDFVSLKDFGAAGDGVTNDSAAFTYAENYVKSSRNILTLTNGDYNLEDIPATPTGGFGNDIKGLYVRSNKPSVLGVVEGSTSAPSRTIDPSLWVQKTVRKDNLGDPYAHNIGAVYGGVVAKGDGVSVTNGTWMSGFFNCKLDGTLLPSGVSDVRGNAIGLAGFAESVKPANGHITCGVWAVGSSPTLTAEEFSNFSGNFSTVGAEINLNINHPQATLGEGKGESAGLLINNYRKGSDHPSDPTVRDISYGLRLNGTDINGTYASNNVDIYSGYQVGIKLDKIKYHGIEFGKYMANGAIGIKFPNNYAGMERRMDTGIALGDHKINLGGYTGSNFFDSDLWLNAGNLYLKTNGSTRTMLGTTGVGADTSNTTTHTIRVNIGGVLYDILARKV